MCCKALSPHQIPEILSAGPGEFPELVLSKFRSTTPRNSIGESLDLDDLNVDRDLNLFSSGDSDDERNRVPSTVIVDITLSFILLSLY
ncbi:hypothetical protein KQX54_011028 [Cotesia glomerata]|uniref:Uncharacterized protein n=1 Tax=Cotesia glomerata TaxID=32391 RepID=A0AAV7IMT1_COTGL|nr:hypothetical protein KQX54_011028 [Cotesia glomerata]